MTYWEDEGYYAYDASDFERDKKLELIELGLVPGDIFSDYLVELYEHEREPDVRHMYFHIEMQELIYFAHVNNEKLVIDTRTIDSRYAKNLYRWYSRRGEDESNLFMQNLKNRFEQDAVDDFKDL